MVDRNKDPDIHSSMVRFYIQQVNSAQMNNKQERIPEILQDIPDEILYNVVDSTDTWDYLSVDKSRELGLEPHNTEYLNDRGSTNNTNDRVVESDVISPSHYKEIVPGYEYMDMMMYMLPDPKSHLLGQIYKYLMRCGKKDEELQELKKAQWYLNYLITHLGK
jgi:hypothetical protein